MKERMNQENQIRDYIVISQATGNKWTKANIEEISTKFDSKSHIHPSKVS